MCNVIPTKVRLSTPPPCEEIFKPFKEKLIVESLTKDEFASNKAIPDLKFETTQLLIVVFQALFTKIPWPKVEPTPLTSYPLQFKKVLFLPTRLYPTSGQ